MSDTFNNQVHCKRQSKTVNRGLWTVDKHNEKGFVLRFLEPREVPGTVKRNVLQRSAGFTFVELIVALTLLAVLFIPVMQLFSHSIYATTHTNDMITATTLAKSYMEKTMNLRRSEKQLIRNGDKIIPPLEQNPIALNRGYWRVKREVIGGTSPLEIRIHVYQVNKPIDPMKMKVPEKLEEHGLGKPVVTLVTLLEDFTWESVQPVS